MKRIRLLIVILMAWAGVMAQEPAAKAEREREMALVAEVKDHLTHDAVKVREGALLWAADSSFVDSLKIEFDTIEYNMQTYGYVSAKVKQAGEYLLLVEADGYVTRYVPVNIKKMYKKERYRSLKPIYMKKPKKKLDLELDEVVVQATKLKFYMDGDTLVYDADAFQMAEGSMLDALLKKLPGVEMEKGGVIKVNGKKVDAMLLNGKDFFDSDRELLLDNMPAYMVKNVKSYERVPKSVRGTNREKGAKKELVMDVRLKREYHAGWLANAEVGSGISFYKNQRGKVDGKYLTRLFGMHFNDISRLTLYLNANNLNDYAVPGEKGEWSPLTQSEGLSKRVKMGGNYRYSPDDNMEYQGNLDGAYLDNTTENSSNTETFLSGGNTFGRSFYNKRSYDYELNTRHELRMMKEMEEKWLKYYSLYVSPALSYRNWNSRTETGDVTLAEDVAALFGKAWVDSIQSPMAGELLSKYAINRTISRRKNVGHSLDANLSGYAMAGPAHNDYVHAMTDFGAQWTNRKEDGYEHYVLDYPKSPSTPPDWRNRYMPTKNKTAQLSVSPTVYFYFDYNHKHSMSVRYSYQYNYNYSDSPLYLLNKLTDWADPNAHPLGTLPSVSEMLTTLDTYNSSLSEKHTHKHNPQLSYRINLMKPDDDKYSSVDFGLQLPTTIEKLDYNRGTQVDTLMRRTTTFLMPSVSYFYDNWKKGRSMNVMYTFSKSAPNLTNMLNIRDDSNPLYVTLGNPGLKNTKIHSLNASYSDKWGRTLFNTNGQISVTQDAVASGFIFDKTTGVRTVTPENVNGNWSAMAGTGVNIPLGKDEMWRIRNNLSYSYNNSVDLSGTSSTLVATRSVVKTHNITEGLGVTLTPNKKMEFGVSGRMNLQHSASEREDFTNISAYTFQYGMNAQIELPWKIQLSTDLTMYSRRGYSDSSMNTNELVWNARVSKKMLKDKLTIIFDGFDLLGNLSNVRRYINAQGKSETFYNVIPSYGLVHVVWRL